MRFRIFIFLGFAYNQLIKSEYPVSKARMAIPGLYEGFRLLNHYYIPL